jgi:hypothetical protein
MAVGTTGAGCMGGYLNLVRTGGGGVCDVGKVVECTTNAPRGASRSGTQVERAHDKEDTIKESILT